MKRLEYADIAKAIAIFLVVLGHTNWVFQDRGWLYIDVCYAFHMPLFFALAGLFLKPKETYSWSGWRRFLAKNFIALMLPYFIWGLIGMQFTYVNVAKLAWGSWLLEKEIGTITVLWYLPAFFMARIYCEAVFHLANRLRVSSRLSALVAVPVFFATGMLLPHHNSLTDGIGNFMGFDIAFVAAAFMLSGYLVRKGLDSFAAAPIWAIASACAVSTGLFVGGMAAVRPLVTTGVDNTVAMCNAVYGPLQWFFANAYTGSAAIVFAAILLARIPFDRRFIRYVGMNTMGVFLLHKPIILEFKRIFSFSPDNVWEALYLAVPAFFLSLALIRVFTRFAPALVGKFASAASVSDVMALILGEEARTSTLERETLRKMLQAFERTVLSDGRVDFDETTMLERFIRPLSESKGGAYREFHELILRTRADGVITAEESAALAEGLRKLREEC